MKENLLYRFSLIISLCGFIFLILIFLYVHPKELDSVEIAQDQSVQFHARIASIHETSSGSSLQLIRECTQEAYLSSVLPSDLKNASVLVTGTLSGDFFTISSMKVLDSK